jgi:hypothetical protein
MQDVTEVLRACWECREVDDLDLFEKLTLDSFVAVLDVISAVADGGDDRGEVGAEADFLFQVQFPEATVSATAVPNSLCHIFCFWMCGSRAGWGSVTSLGSSKRTTILKHPSPQWSQHRQQVVPTYTT